MSTPSDLAALLQKTQQLMHTGQLAAAAACLDQAAATGGTDQQIDVLRAQVSGARQDPAGALEALDRVLAQDPGIPQLVFGRIHALYSLGRLDDALDAIAATEAAVGTPLRHNLNGLRVMCLQRHGTAEQIRPILDELISVEGHSPRIVGFEIDLLRRTGAVGEAIARSEALLARADLNAPTRASAGLTLARLLDRAGRYDDAFHAAQTANDAGSQPFDAEEFERETNELIQFFTAETMQGLSHSRETSDRPVFVIGMPRSGTSMLEQIIASHPQGGGVGERQDPFILAEDLSVLLGQPLPGALTRATMDQLDGLAKRYLDMFGSASVSGDRIVNKALGLDRLVGFLSILLPNARFVWLHRDAADNQLSIYLHTILKPWAWRLDDIARVRRMHDRLGAHWLALMPERHLELSYESLTAEQAKETSRLLDFLDMPPDQATLRFHESARAVMTPSAEQVRQPMHQNAVGRWKHYADYLAPTPP